MALPPLLVTSSVGVFAPFTSLQNPSDRIFYTMEAIAKWQAIPGLRIVICDGSSFDFTDRVTEKFPDAAIECLAFENDQVEVARRGKGFGEGEIVKHALANSRFIAQTSYFAKVTAKLFVLNFLDFIPIWNDRFLCDCTFKPAHQFWLGVRFWGIDTRFYIANKRFYADNFLEAHKRVDDNAHHSLEWSFQKAIEDVRMRRVIMPFKPMIEGMSGSTSNPYVPARRSLGSRAERWVIAAQSRYIARPLSI